jgi:holo-[acyl-carrier protein] synthase
MIQGIGVDVVELARIKEMLGTQGETFVNKIFTESEIAYCQSKPAPEQHYAARFAAKEAVSKALQTGWSGVFRWKDVEVQNDPSGAPKIFLYNKLAEVLAKSSVHVSLSHSDTTVVAFAIVESR